MSSTFSKICLHLVLPISPEWQTTGIKANTIRRYTEKFFLANGCTIHACAVQKDHAHILFDYDPSMSLSKLLTRMRASIQFDLSGTDQRERAQFWDSGEAIFSVSPGQLPIAIDYILRDNDRHRKIAFRAELLRLFEYAGIEYRKREGNSPLTSDEKLSSRIQSPHRLPLLRRLFKSIVVAWLSESIDPPSNSRSSNRRIRFPKRRRPRRRPLYLERMFRDM